MINSVKIFASPKCNEYYLFDDANNHVGYYYKHFVNPESLEKLDSPVFEVYYDKEDGDFNSSMIFDDEDEFFDFIDNRVY